MACPPGGSLHRAILELGAFSFDSSFSRCIHSTCRRLNREIPGASTLTRYRQPLSWVTSDLNHDLLLPRIAISVLVVGAVLGREATEAFGGLDDATRDSANASEGCRCREWFAGRGVGAAPGARSALRSARGGSSGDSAARRKRDLALLFGGLP